MYQRERKILISPLRLRLVDEDLVEEIADRIEEAWDQAIGLSGIRSGYRQVTAMQFFGRVCGLQDISNFLLSGA